MAKVGVEVEGKFKGLTTLFADVTEIQALDYKKIKEKTNVSSLYISDHNNELSLSDSEFLIHEVFPIIDIIIIECTKVTCLNRDFILVLYVKNEDYFKLYSNDQVKFEKDLKVSMFSVESAYMTSPKDFENDTVVPEEYYIKGEPNDK